METEICQRTVADAVYVTVEAVVLGVGCRCSCKEDQYEDNKAFHDCNEAKIS
jgi:hypothetical protein